MKTLDRSEQHFWGYQILGNTYEYEFVSDCPRGYRLDDGVPALCGEPFCDMRYSQFKKVFGIAYLKCQYTLVQERHNGV